MPRSIDRAKWVLWQQRLDRFNDSELTVADFCRRVGCSVPTFYAWKRKLQATKPIRCEPVASFLPVQVAGSLAIEVRLRGGTVLELPADAVDALNLILRADRESQP
jgi:hypothetical protein